MRVVGDTLYTTHYEWVDAPDGGRLNTSWTSSTTPTGST